MIIKSLMIIACLTQLILLVEKMVGEQTISELGLPENETVIWL